MTQFQWIFYSYGLVSAVIFAACLFYFLLCLASERWIAFRESRIAKLSDKWRPFGCLLISVLFSACAELHTPCEFDVHVKVVNEQTANALCHASARLRNDYGNPVADDTQVYGCASKSNIITRTNRTTRDHEFNHAVEKNCQ